MIRYFSLAALLSIAAGCQHGKPASLASTALQSSQAAPQGQQQRERFLVDVERRVEAARRQPASFPPETVREMEELLQTLRRSPNPELLLGAMLAGASPVAQSVEPTPEVVYQQALAAEQLGLKQDAISLYRRAAEGGHAVSATRMRELAPAASAMAPPGGPGTPPVNAARFLSSGTITAGSSSSSGTVQTPEMAFARASVLEQNNQLEKALALYVDSSQRGHAPASQRLMEIFAYGASGLTRDYVVAVKYKELAMRQGSQIEVLPRR